MRKGIGCGLVAVTVLGLGAKDGEAQTAPRVAPPAPVGVRVVTAAPQVDWSTIADKAMKGAEVAVRLWQQSAGFTSGVVVQTTLTTRPGDLQGPSLRDWMASQMIADGAPAPVAAKFAKAFADAWARWQSRYFVAGLPVYPAFAAFPGPQAPPMPNVPFPLAAGSSAELVAMTPPELVKALKAELGELAAQAGAQRAVDVFAAAAASAFTDWTATQMVTLVLGRGNVPTYAPPYVPVGPVVTGDIIPGQHFTTGGGFVSGTALTAFDAKLGQWAVKLESGRAFRSAQQTTLSGTISIRRDGWPTAFRLRDAVLTLQTEATATATATTAQATAAAVRPTADLAVQKSLTNLAAVTAYARGAGAATLEIVAGGTTLTYPTSTVRFTGRPDGSLGFEVDTLSSDVCRIQLGSGSGALQTGARLAWKMTCPHDVSTDADLLLTGSALTGSGTLKAYNATFGVSYSLDTAQKLMRIKGGWAAGSTAWRGVPGIEQQLDYAVESPRVTLEWALPASAVADAKRDAKPRPTITFDAGKLMVRTRATRPSGAPWATASTSNVSAQMFYDGTIKAPLPQPPQPTPEPLGQPLCNVSCDFLKSKGMSGVVPPAPPLLAYSADQAKCQVSTVPACSGPTVCPPGQAMVDEGGKRRCRVPVPSVPSVPPGPKVRQLVP